MWKNLIIKVSEEPLFNEPATQVQLEEINEKFNLEITNELANLLKETNGFDSGGVRFWSSNEIIEENVERRTLEVYKDCYMSFDSLLFFADAGNGDFFGFSIINGHIQKDDIYVWNHEDDSRTWIAPSLEEFFIWWSEGSISI
ncbi:SMI1/KNR4 family protein [Gottfriedia sp. NPDC057991]|uniref:SMI1/KNR4 family protein n=1 Tax=Gottfriedia sp. NPDC057991 TaxID=3346298 RepID=UPI0036DAB2C6